MSKNEQTPWAYNQYSDGGGGQGSMGFSLRDKLAAGLDQETKARYLASILGNYASAYGDPSIDANGREMFRQERMQIDPNSLVNGGARLFDNGGVIPNQKQAQGGGFQMNQPGATPPMPERQRGTNPALREAAIRREAQFQKGLRDQFGDGRSQTDQAMQRAQLHEQELRNRQLALQNNAFNADRAAEADNQKQNRLMQLLQVIGGLRL